MEGEREIFAPWKPHRSKYRVMEDRALKAQTISFIFFDSYSVTLFVLLAKYALAG